MNANVWARLLDERGRVVPGSERCGHNVLTVTGREWLTNLIHWPTIDVVDVPETDNRVRWIGVGGGVQSEVEGVVSLHTPLEVTSGIYLAALSEAPTFPTAVSVKFHHIFGAADISFPDPKVVTEFALYVDSNPVLDLDDTIGTQTPVAYKVLDEGLVKISGFSLELFWEFKF